MAFEKNQLSKDKMENYLSIVESNVKRMVQNKKYEDKSILDGYRDPDTKTVQEINGFRLASDVICGVSYLRKNIGDNDKLIRYYSILRRFIILWPRHREGINQRRFRKYRDRFDFTLYDISLFFENMNKNYDVKNESYLVKNESPTFKWLSTSFNCSFIDFCKCMGYERFIDVNTGKVFNLSCGNGREKYISNINDYKYNSEINERYLDNLVRCISGN